jgi:hypothetical protein
VLLVLTGAVPERMSHRELSVADPAWRRFDAALPPSKGIDLWGTAE